MKDTILEAFVRDRIAQLMLQEGLTAYSLANLVDIPPASIYRCMAGQTKATLQLQEKVCNLLHMSMKEFYAPLDAQSEGAAYGERFAAFQKMDKRQRKLWQLSGGRLEDDSEMPKP